MPSLPVARPRPASVVNAEIRALMLRSGGRLSAGVRDRSFDRLTGPEGANAWLAKAQHESTRGEFIDPRDGSILLSDYVEQEWWPSRDYTDPSTIAIVKNNVFKHIVPQLGGLPLNAVKTPQLRTWLASLGATLGPGSINDTWGGALIHPPVCRR